MHYKYKWHKGHFLLQAALVAIMHISCKQWDTKFHKGVRICEDTLNIGDYQYAIHHCQTGPKFHAVISVMFACILVGWELPTALVKEQLYMGEP